MVKEPRAGRVKTRLGRDIGVVRAAWWFRHQTRSLIRRLRDPRWHIILAVSPDFAGLHSRIWPSYLPRVGQGSGDLGARMGRLARSMPPGPVCIIGSDIPDVNLSHIATAFRTLESSDVVVGPAEDGGYWLIGFKRTRALPPTLFDGVRWSTEHALSDTLSTLQGVRVGRVSELSDVDTGADLRRWTK